MCDKDTNVPNKTDFISREAASDLLAMALIDEWEPEYAQDRLSEIPAADVRPVVKCLECENALRDDSHKIVHCNQNGEPGYVWCKKEGCCRAEDFFCANGVSCSCGAGMREVDADGES